MCYPIWVSLTHALLGLLSLKPMTGYELKKVMDGSVSHFWNADQSQIYRQLAKLVDDGLASRTTVQQDERPAMHVHSPTQAGLEELDRWLASPLPEEVSREPFLARLFFAGRMEPAAVRALLAARRAQAEAMLATLTAIEDAEQPTPDPVEELRWATLRNGLAHARAELAWLRETEERWGRLLPEDGRAGPP